MNSWPKTIYVCDACDFAAMEPVEHMHQYPRIPTPGFHKHTAEMMLPYEVVPKPSHVTGVRLMHEALPNVLTPQPPPAPLPPASPAPAPPTPDRPPPHECQPPHPARRPPRG